MQNEKVRIYVLAHELDMKSEALIDLCRKHGMEVKNQLNTLTPEQRDTIVALLRKGPAASAAQPLVPPTLPPKHVPNLTVPRVPGHSIAFRGPAAGGRRAAGGRTAGRRPCFGEADSCCPNRPARRPFRPGPRTADRRAGRRTDGAAARPAVATRSGPGRGQTRRSAAAQGTRKGPRAPGPGAARRRQTA